MEQLFNLEYKNEIEELKDEPDFEKLGDEKYINHHDKEARLLWAFYRPSGSDPRQIEDSDELVCIMAFNHSRLSAIERFKRVHPNVIKDENLRVKIKNRTRMLFRDLMDGDFTELNQVLDIVPCYLDLSVNQLITGRKWNEIDANLIEATKYLNRLPTEFKNEEFYEAFFAKIGNIDDFEIEEVNKYLDEVVLNAQNIEITILNHIKSKVLEWIELNEVHLLKKRILINKMEKF